MLQIKNTLGGGGADFSAVTALVSDVISGKKFYDSNGELKTGELTEAISQMGFNSYNLDVFTPASDTAGVKIYNNYYANMVNHSLGKIPKFAFLLCPALIGTNSYSTSKIYIVASVTKKDSSTESQVSGWDGCVGTIQLNTQGNYNAGGYNQVRGTAFTETQIGFWTHQSAMYLCGGKKHYLFTFA